MSSNSKMTVAQIRLALANAGIQTTTRMTKPVLLKTLDEHHKNIQTSPAPRRAFSLAKPQFLTHLSMSSCLIDTSFLHLS